MTLIGARLPIAWCTASWIVGKKLNEPSAFSSKPQRFIVSYAGPEIRKSKVFFRNCLKFFFLHLKNYLTWSSRNVHINVELIKIIDEQLQRGYTRRIDVTESGKINDQTFQVNGFVSLQGACWLLISHFGGKIKSNQRA